MLMYFWITLTTYNALFTLQSLLEDRFSVILPDELIFEPDATLQTMADVFVAGK